MAVDFTYDLATDIGEIRFLISDTKAEAPAFSDAELAAMLTRGGSIAGAMPKVIQALLMDRARRARTYTRVESGVDPDDATTVAALTTMLDLYTTGPLASRMVRVKSMGRGPSDPLPPGVTR